MAKRSRNLLIVLIAVVYSGGYLYGNTGGDQKKAGNITFITSQNVYVKFDNTEGISKGDTVWTDRKGVSMPVMSVKYISSGSCAGERIGTVNLKTGDEVYVYVKANMSEPGIKKIAGTETDSNAVKHTSIPSISIKRNAVKSESPNLYGSFRANSFSNYANSPNSTGLQRWTYALNVNADRIAGSNFYFSNQMRLSYLSSEWRTVKSNIFSNLMIYDLSLGYKSEGYSIWAGRHTNFSISNVGPIDGLQIEKELGKFKIGGIAGSRPDFNNLAFNFKLFEYGGYVSRTDSTLSGQMQNTLGVFQQTNSGKTDRRFLYFQHNNNLFPDLYFFFSSEIDLYKTQNGKGVNNPSLTSLFLSAQYNPWRKLSINLSYDARRSVVYYETFKSFIDSLFSNELRQGLRLTFFIRPVTGLFINAGAGYSYQRGDIKPSRNLNLSVTQSNIPLLDVSLNVSYNRIFGSYQDGIIYGIRLSKYLPFNFTNISVAYSAMKYNFGNISYKLNQRSVTAELSTRIVKPVYFNLYYEGDFDGRTTYGRFMSGINYRF